MRRSPDSADGGAAMIDGGMPERRVTAHWALRRWALRVPGTRKAIRVFWLCCNRGTVAGGTVLPVFPVSTCHYLSQHVTTCHHLPPLINLNLNASHGASHVYRSRKDI